MPLSAVSTPFIDSTDSSLIDAFYLICGYLGHLSAANVLNDTYETTPELQASSLFPGHPYQSQQPVNANLASGSSDASNKRCRAQWQSARRFIKKIDDYCRTLQQYITPDAPLFLKELLNQHDPSSKVTQTGLLGLKDILMGLPLGDDQDMFCAMLLQHAALVCHQRQLDPRKSRAVSVLRNWKVGLLVTVPEASETAFDILIQRILAVDPSADRGTQLWPGDQTLSGSVQGTGSRFDDQQYYPMGLPEGPLVDNPLQHQAVYPGGLDHNIDPALWFTNQAHDFTMYPRNTQSQPNQLRPFPPFPAPTAGFQMPSFTDSSRISFSSNAVPGPAHHPQQPSPQGHRPHQVPHSHDIAAAKWIEPFLVFKHYIRDMNRLGDLFRVFNPYESDDMYPPRSAIGLTQQVLAKKFDANVKNLSSFLRSYLSQDQLAMGIVSAMGEFAEIGGLGSFNDVGRYMAHLSANLLPSPEAAQHFICIALEKCHEATRSSSRNSKDYLPLPLGLSYRGAHCPTQLLAPNIISHPTYKHGESPSSTGGLHVPSMTFSPALSTHVSNTDTSTVASTPFLGTSASASSEYTVDCPECDKSFKGRTLANARASLSRHKRSHNTSSPMKCRYCAKVFPDSRTDNIRNHCRTAHPEIKVPVGSAAENKLLWESWRAGA